MGKARKLKIGMVLDVTLDSTDGVQQCVLTLGRWLSEQGHDVHYIVGTSKRQDIANVHSLARVINVRFNGNQTGTPLPVSRRKIRRFLAEHQFDVVHVQMPYSPFFAARFVRQLPAETKIVGSLQILPRDRLAVTGLWLLGWILRPSLRRFNTILASTDNVRAYFRRAWGVESLVVPNAIRLASFTAKRPKTAGKIKIVFLGRMVERKGALNFVEAIARLPAGTKQKIEVCMGGKGPMLDQVQALITRHKLHKVVQTTGFVSESDKPAFLAAADIAIFPSIAGESFGVSLLEAMAAGSRVVLAGHNPGYDGVLGERPDLMFDPTNVDEMSRVLRYWIEHPAERLQIQRWLAEHVGQYDIESAVGPELLRIYCNRNTPADNL